MRRIYLTLLISLSIFIVLSNFVMAEIMFSQPKSVYNLGDFIEVSAAIKASSDMNEFLTLSLICNDTPNDFYLSPLSLSAGQTEKVEKKLLLSRAFLGGMIGECKIQAKYGAETGDTLTFQITNKINTALNVNPLNVDAGQNILVKGTAIKANGQNLEGYLEINVDKTNIQLTRIVNQGKFETNFSFPENQKSGDYNLQVKVYDKSGEEIGNQNIENLELTLRQKPSKIEIAIDKQSIVPGESLKFVPIIYDQANEKVSGDLKIEIKDSLDEVIFNRLVKTNEEVNIDFPLNSSPGYWKIEASALDLKTNRLFYIEEAEKASFEIINDTLIITNIGNVLYNKAVQIAIGDSVEVKQMMLDIGESKRFRLLAPDGNYKVSITDGSETLTLGSVGLTGNVIGVMDLRKQLSMFNKYPIVWIFLILVLGLFILLMFQKVIKKKSVGYPTEKPFGHGKGKEDFKEFKVVKDIKEAEHSLVTNGNKEEAGIFVLKIKNLDKLKKEKGNALESIEKAKEKINHGKGSSYMNGNDIIGIFTPLATKTFKNDLQAVKVASEIAAYLNEHNKKFTQKIDFGIGINSGDIVAKLHNEKLMFTALGNTLNTARKIADKAENDALLSHNLNNRIMHEVKTEKKGEYYSIKRIVDRE